jgi:hypothetical protein
MSRFFVVIAAVLAATIVSVAGGVGASAPEPTEENLAVHAGADPYYLKSRTGAGAGGANQNSSLSVACAAGERMLGAGFASVDRGTRVSASYLAALTPDAWRVQWRNNATVDEVTVSVICGPAAFGVVDVLRWHRTALNSTNALLRCPTDFGIANGGFAGIDPTTGLRTSFGTDSTPQDYWQLGTTVSGSDTQMVQAICIGNHVPYTRNHSLTGGGGANATATFTAACDAGDLITGVGFSDIDDGTHLEAARPISARTARFTYRNNATPDPIVGQVLCLDATP